eukprot:365954-Chlamydomonas_euryale.AAC.3
MLHGLSVVQFKSPPGRASIQAASQPSSRPAVHHLVVVPSIHSASLLFSRPASQPASDQPSTRSSRLHLSIHATIHLFQPASSAGQFSRPVQPAIFSAGQFSRPASQPTLGGQHGWVASMAAWPAHPCICLSVLLYIGRSHPMPFHPRFIHSYDAHFSAFARTHTHTHTHTHTQTHTSPSIQFYIVFSWACT